MDPPGEEGFLREDPPSLDTLCDDQTMRFHELEKHISRIEPRVRLRQEYVLAMRTHIRKREREIFSSFSVEHEYMDGPMLKPQYSVFDLLHVPSGRVVIYSGDENILLHIGETIRQQLEEDTIRLDLYVADAMRWRRGLDSFREDLGMRYASIEAIGEENPDDSRAQVYTIAKTPGVAVTAVDMRLGSAEAVHVEEGTTRDEFFSEQVQQQIKEAHHACTHNTYIIMHPSDVLDQYQLGLMSGRILQNRWLELHPELIN